MAMKKHMIFFDIDGTLLDETEHVVPESAVRALRQARAQGHLLFICTGRCQAIWPKEVMDIGFDGVVGGCGTQILFHGRELHHAVLEPKLQRRIAKDLQRFHIDGVLEGRDASYFRRDYWMPAVKAIFEENKKISPSCTMFWEEETLRFDKMALWFDGSSDMEGFKAVYEDRFDFIRRDPTFYEVVPKGYSKATGIRFLCDHLGIAQSETMGIGDSTNDLPMLAFTGISVAMGSGNPDIFSEVDYVTAPVMENGIQKALEKFGMIR